MRTSYQALAAIAVMLLTGAVPPAQADQFERFGEYQVHYNAFTSNVLQPAIAKSYGITRSKNRGVLTVSVLQDVMGTPGKPISAGIEGTATNLNGQLKALAIREIREGNAIYYIGEFPVTNQETLDFNLAVELPGQEAPVTVRFRKQFFTE
jgi:hypothetical protein